MRILSRTGHEVGHAIGSMSQSQMRSISWIASAPSLKLPYMYTSLPQAPVLMVSRCCVKRMKYASVREVPLVGGRRQQPLGRGAREEVSHTKVYLPR